MLVPTYPLLQTTQVTNDKYLAGHLLYHTVLIDFNCSYLPHEIHQLNCDHGKNAAKLLHLLFSFTGLRAAEILSSPTFFNCLLWKTSISTLVLANLRDIGAKLLLADMGLLSKNFNYSYGWISDT